MKYKAKVLLSIFILLSGGTCAQTGVYMDSIVGQVAEGKLVAGERVAFLLSVRNNSADTVTDIVHSFRVYSLDDGNWTPHLFDYIEDTVFYIQWRDPDGSGPLAWLSDIFSGIWGDTWSDLNHLGMGSDTIGVFGSPPLLGIPPGYDLMAWRIEIDSISLAGVGDTICLDSCQGDQQQLWAWFSGPSQVQFLPEWDGPHCFEIVADCCEGFRGNINLDLQDTIDISDLTALVGWMFKSGAPPPCMLEADVDGNSSHDIADVTYLVGYMFKSGPEPAACP